MLNAVKKALEERESHLTEARRVGADSNRKNNERWQFCNDKVAAVPLWGRQSFPVRMKGSHSLSFSHKYKRAKRELPGQVPPC